MDQKFFRSNAVYQIYPRSFCDSNGDGIGDIPGIISKLDYLKDLGTGIIWLSPVYKSPNADYGYDISDYYSINPEFGTMDDMMRLISEAKKRGIRIVMDLVVNHTSDEHLWFIGSKDPKSKYHKYYYWRKGKKNNTAPPNNWTSQFGGPAWEYVPETDEWYLHLFSKKQPDLDWHNPDVLEEVERILRFWLDRGIYGFRCDVINQIWKESLDDGKPAKYSRGMEHYLMRDGNHKILHKLYEDVFSHYDCMTVGETYNVDVVNAKRFTHEELDMVFQFDLVNCDRRKIPVFTKPFHPRAFKKIIFKWQSSIDWNANFFENHDQIRSVERFGDGKRYWKESAKMLAALLMTLRGTPYIYEGEEIGMKNLEKFGPEDYRDPVNDFVYGEMRKFLIPKKTAQRLVRGYTRDNARTPMQWDASENAGFSAGKPWIVVNPNYKEINVAAEEDDKSSILNFYKAAIKLRKETPALSYGAFERMKTPGSVIAYTRGYEGRLILVIANLTGKRRSIPKKLRSDSGKVLLSNYEGVSYGYKKHLRPYEVLVVRIH
jgi:oligo-1,6-glucosidase